MTRSDYRKVVVDLYSACKVRIKRNQNLEKLLVSRRSAKVCARRKTIALGITPSTFVERSVLFKNIKSKPFTTRRHSVNDRLPKSDVTMAGPSKLVTNRVNSGESQPMNKSNVAVKQTNETNVQPIQKSDDQTMNIGNVLESSRATVIDKNNEKPKLGKSQLFYL